MKRTKICDRILPNYTKAQEFVNAGTHLAGLILGLVVLLLSAQKAQVENPGIGIAGPVIYGISMILLYAASSIYHGTAPGYAKKVLQVIDHCTIYFLIAGTYTPIMLCAFMPRYPQIAWLILATEWGLCIIATVLTAIDLKAYNVFSMICYIGMGWAIIFFIPQCMECMTARGFAWLLAGGITYTVGAVLYGIGSKVPWIHSVFHIFVLLGSWLQLVAIVGYAF